MDNLSAKDNNSWGKTIIDLNEFAKEVHNNAVEPGWWEDDRGFGEMIALCHSEFSEALRYRALEEYRNGCGE